MKNVIFGIFILSGMAAAIVAFTAINAFFLKAAGGPAQMTTAAPRTAVFKLVSSAFDRTGSIGTRVVGTWQIVARPVAARTEPAKNEIRREGPVTRISRSLAERLKADNNLILYSIAVKLGPDGVKIVSVDRGSITQRMGIAPGDTIREVNGHKLSSTEDTSGVYEAVKDATSFEVKILRKGKPKTLRYEIR
jgi:S1-C subfamily serine protease